MRYTYIVPRGCAMRWRADGVAPTDTTGMYVEDGEYIELKNVPLDRVLVVAVGKAETQNQIDVLCSDYPLTKAEILSTRER